MLYSFWIWFVVSVVIGVAACFVLDVVPHKYFSAPQVYAIWAVLGIFSGFLHFSFSQAQLKGTDGATDWASREEARRLGGHILLITAAQITGIAAICYPLFWSSQSNLEVLFLVVPDHMGASLTYLVLMLATTAFANHLFMPSARP
mgnify:CR=1 FL=1